MALTRFGYTGTVNQDQWAKIMGIAGLAYGIQDFNGLGWGATAVGGARQTSMAPGRGVGHGVLVVTDAAEVLTHAAPAGGRWDLITMRRDWATPTNTGFVVTPHETLTTNAVPSAPPTTWPASIFGNVENNSLNAGTGQDHQPLYWAWVNNLNTNVLYFDLRGRQLSSKLAAEIGLVALKPSSVGGVGAVLNSDGSMSFSGTTYVFMNGLFDGKYRDYQLELEISGTTGGTQNAQLALNFRAAGADQAVSHAGVAVLGVAGVVSAPAISGAYPSITPQPALLHRASLRLGAPGVSGQPSITGQVNSLTAGGVSAVANINITEISPVTARDGLALTILTAGMTLTGRMRVYGLK